MIYSIRISLELACRCERVYGHPGWIDQCSESSRFPWYCTMTLSKKCRYITAIFAKEKVAALIHPFLPP